MDMKKILVIILIIPFYIQAQKHEINIGYGSGLYYGDLNVQNDNKNLINPFTEFTKKILNLLPLISKCVAFNR